MTSDEAPHDELLVGAKPTPAPLTERRRPGRVDYSNPALIELLRDPSDTEAPEHRDDLSPAKGIFIAIAMAIPLWGIIGLAIWSVYVRG
jgi:hypothetical protein